MDQKAAPNTNKALIIAAFVISFLCLAAGLFIGNQLEEAWSNHLFWLYGLIVVSATAGIGATWWYGANRRRGLKRELSKKTEALRKSEDKYRSLVESAEDFIFTVDESGCFQSLNNFTANFFGGTPSQFLGRPISVLFSEAVASRQFKLIR
ncbi:MAG: PAS domain S-box protein, partial [Deltaproteobacteria bacterium]|nr:PAS domain S-box protein [Deltaproteobacteria bacterium]